MKKRTWFKRSSLILSTAVSLIAPSGKMTMHESKSSKPCKKSKAPLSSVADEGDADTGPPFGDEPPGAGCCTAPELPAEESGRELRARPPLEKRRAARYAWNKEITTTVFWIGEQPTEENPMPNQSSSWDEQWTEHYGGFDDPDPEARKGFVPAKFTPKQNPFYIALPYNDLASEGHKEEASTLIPWFKKEFTSKWKSVCKGRWIAIRKGSRVCYAQWEDAGPFTTTDAEYVFGGARPKANANDNAGLDVSPAVRDYLGLDGSDVTDWKFVEFENVPLGPWAEHGENNDFVMNPKREDKGSVAATPAHEAQAGRRRNRSSG